MLGASNVPAHAAPPSRHPMINWGACPHYSAAVVQSLGYTNVARFRRLMARTDCGTLRVPFDYGRPGGRQITIALTRLEATDPAHRLGSLAVNPGDPGASGYLMPIDLLLTTSGGPVGSRIVRSLNAKLNERYDLIGFDRRGVGYSTKYSCPSTPRRGPGPSGSVTEETARGDFAAMVNTNRTCGSSKPRFLASLTTVNMARDLDMIRRALGERKLSYLGATWGTRLGAVYRSLFPAKVSRMWLESAVNPQSRLDMLEADRAKATAMNFSRLAAWIAAHNDTYGFGSTGEQVEAALAQLRQSYDANPRTFSDLDRPVDGSLIAELAAQPTRAGWATVAQALTELRDATGPTAPPSIADRSGPRNGEGPPPNGAPEGNNRTLNQAVVCNEDTGRRDFESAWAAYQQRLQLYPTTGRTSSFVPACAGWPPPVEPVTLRHSAGSLVLSGHRYETESPYTSTRAMQSAIGGTVFTVEDDVRESGLHEPECVRRILAYFDTGDPGGDGCSGYRGEGKGRP
jgi:pimeloyl-ACP methyl ester carboxylesterase